MRKKVKSPLIGANSQVAPDDEIVDDEIETEKFINRLAIQRKLLNNLVDLTTKQTNKQVEIKKKSPKLKSIKFNKN